MFRRIWPRKEPHHATTGNAELDTWFNELRESIDTQPHPTASSINKALLALETLRIAEQLKQEQAPISPRTPTADATGQPDRRSAISDQELTLPVPRIETSDCSDDAPPGGAEGCPAPENSSGRQRRAHKIVLSGVVIGTALAVVGTAAVVGPNALLGNGNDDTITQLAGTTTLRVGVLPVVDVAPFYRALDAGYFAEEGLTIEVAVTPSGPGAIDELVAGKLDVAFTSYPGILKAQSDKRADLKIIAPAYAARPGHLMLVAPPDGSIQRAEDVAGKRIAVTSRDSISDLGVMSELQTRGVDFSGIQWMPMAMPDMSIAMQEGKIDGAVLAEPYITLTDNSFHARPILDVGVGKTARMPMTGWGVLGTTGQTKPHAAEAFVRALDRGRRDVADRAVLDPILEKHLGIDALTAKEVNVADFTQSLDAAEIQRVADLMRTFNVIREPLDVRPMLLAA
jgi:NitT/TauT family transport system substrate-binding protein